MSISKSELTDINKSSGWQEFWLKEDWWAVWLGLGIVILAYVFYLVGSSISWIAVAPAKWSTLVTTCRSIFNECHSVLCFACCFFGSLHHRGFIHRTKAKGIYSIFYFSLCSFNNHLLRGKLGSGQVAIILSRRWWLLLSD